MPREPRTGKTIELAGMDELENETKRKQSYCAFEAHVT